MLQHTRRIILTVALCITAFAATVGQALAGNPRPVIDKAVAKTCDSDQFFPADTQATAVHVQTGDCFKYRFAMSNTAVNTVGPQANANHQLQRARLDDPTLGITEPVGTIVPGQTVYRERRVIAGQPGVVTNRACLTGFGAWHSKWLTDCDTAVVVVTARPTPVATAAVPPAPTAVQTPPAPTVACPDCAAAKPCPVCISRRVYRFRVKAMHRGHRIVAVTRVLVRGTERYGEIQHKRGRYIVTADYRGIRAPAGQVRTVVVFVRLANGKAARLSEMLRLCLPADGNPNDPSASNRID